ncbi:dehydrogenase [Gorillibacterium sp. sgz5001074]|uniref:dehydrogenase n=1 Tax=Gorillibacterium sp. sgz5001074 TaxID=3446695 RepID=UPI003F67234F
MNNQGKHEKPLPNARQIRRSCGKELYRTVKRLKRYIPPEQIQQAEELYVKKVMLNLLWIADNGSNRKVLADWFEEHVAPEIAPVWGVETEVLSRAFRESFGG